MLPKLQQSSIANSLRRDNLASQIQCTTLLIQAKTNSKTSLESKTINPTNHGKTHMRPKTLTLPSATSPKSTSQKKSLNRLCTNPSMSLRSQALSPSIQKRAESEAALQAPSKRRQSSRNQCPNQAHSKRGKSPFLSSDATTIEEICPSE